MEWERPPGHIKIILLSILIFLLIAPVSYANFDYDFWNCYTLCDRELCDSPRCLGASENTTSIFIINKGDDVITENNVTVYLNDNSIKAVNYSDMSHPYLNNTLLLYNNMLGELILPMGISSLKYGDVFKVDIGGKVKSTNYTIKHRDIAFSFIPSKDSFDFDETVFIEFNITGETEFGARSLCSDLFVKNLNIHCFQSNGSEIDYKRPGAWYAFSTYYSPNLHDNPSLKNDTCYLRKTEYYNVDFLQAQGSCKVSDVDFSFPLNNANMDGVYYSFNIADSKAFYRGETTTTTSTTTTIVPSTTSTTTTSAPTTTLPEEKNDYISVGIAFGVVLVVVVLFLFLRKIKRN